METAKTQKDYPYQYYSPLPTDFWVGWSGCEVSLVQADPYWLTCQS
jgi:hypothetical protein